MVSLPLVVGVSHIHLKIFLLFHHISTFHCSIYVILTFGLSAISITNSLIKGACYDVVMTVKVVPMKVAWTVHQPIQ